VAYATRERQYLWPVELAPGATIAGPAVIAEDETSTFVSTSFDAHIDGAGSIVMERKAA